MPICDPCAQHADDAVNKVRGELDSVGHDPSICREHGRGGCGCQHRPVGTATNGEDQPHA